MRPCYRPRSLAPMRHIFAAAWGFNRPKHITHKGCILLVRARPIGTRRTWRLAPSFVRPLRTILETFAY